MSAGTQDTPRRVRGGLKLANVPPSPRGWVARRWLRIVEELVELSDRRGGLEYARKGQVTKLDVQPGVVEARVQGRQTQPYAVRWTMPVIDERHWERVIDSMAAEAFYAAKLLANEVPPAFGRLFTTLGQPLVPGPEVVSVSCDCGARRPCKHAVAVGFLLTERLDADPPVIFGLRGMPQLADRVNAARARASHGAAAAQADPPVGAGPGPAAPLEAELDRFWRAGPELSRLSEMPPPHHAPHALLRRLGPSPLPGRFPMLGLLASIYDLVASAAVRLRDHAEGLDGKD